MQPKVSVPPKSLAGLPLCNHLPNSKPSYLVFDFLEEAPKNEGTAQHRASEAPERLLVEPTLRPGDQTLLART